jgi:hypothetical protein
MPNPMIRIHDIESGEVIDREMTTAELADYKKEQLASQKAQTERDAKPVEKAALLERLGITADEAALLLG